IFDPEDKRYAEAGEFRRIHDEDPDVQKVVEIAKGVEGLTRGWGVHACAVIMSSDPLVDIVPMMRRPSDGQIITQFEYPTLETLGLGDDLAVGGTAHQDRKSTRLNSS